MQIGCFTQDGDEFVGRLRTLTLWSPRLRRPKAE